MIDFPGQLAGVFFVSGCNFRCGFCHNAALLARMREGVSWNQLGRVCEAFRANWVSAAVVTGGEPTLRPELLDLLEYFRSAGWRVKLDTNGSRPVVLRDCLPLVDYVAMDIKAAPSRYRDLTGYGETQDIHESIALIRAKARDYEFRTTIIESFHDDAQMQEVGALIDGARRYVMQPFVPRPDIPSESLRAVPRTSPQRMSELASLMAPYVHEVSVRGR